MRNLLSPGNRGVLATLAASRTLLAFDFDGTLAPIVADRDAVAMRARTAELLAQLCSRYPCAVISGRSLADVSALLEGIAVRFVVGNHGLEPGAGLAGFEQETAEVRARLGAALGGIAGVDIEDKRFSLAVHYRRADNKRAARLAIRRAVAALPIPVRVVPGKLVVNVVPLDAPDKGAALLQLRARDGAEVAFFVGDDVTDEDVFVLEQPGRLVTARIGASTSSRATYFLNNQMDIDALLAAFIALRPAP